MPSGHEQRYYDAPNMSAPAIAKLETPRVIDGCIHVAKAYLVQLDLNDAERDILARSKSGLCGCPAVWIFDNCGSVRRVLRMPLGGDQ
jgi:hypothetical protein